MMARACCHATITSLLMKCKVSSDSTRPRNYSTWFFNPYKWTDVFHLFLRLARRREASEDSNLGTHMVKQVHERLGDGVNTFEHILTFGPAS